MKKILLILGALLVSSTLFASDERQLVELPEHMQVHMLGNMRDHLATLGEATRLLAEQNYEKAAEVVESRLGMSSLELHGAAHMAKFMPKPMREMGTEMHKASSRLARSIQEGEPQQIFRNLSQLTTRCNACHTHYRVK